MIKTLKNSILYFLSAALLTSALITIRPVAKSSADNSSPAKTTETTKFSHPAKDLSSFELKLSQETLLFTAYDSAGSVQQQTTIDYIDIYSLYPEQISALKNGISFNSRESAAEFIQDLGS